MGRPARVDEGDLFAAVSRLVAAEGPMALTTRRIASEVGVPTGSLYHRFSDRDLLVARAWLDAVRRFQPGFVEALDAVDVDAAVQQAAAYTPRWAGDHPAHTSLLLRYSRDQLLQAWPGELAADLAAVNRPVEQVLRRHARRRWGTATAAHVELLRFAVITVPAAAVRDHADPTQLTVAVSEAASAIVSTLPSTTT